MADLLDLTEKGKECLDEIYQCFLVEIGRLNDALQAEAKRADELQELVDKCAYEDCCTLSNECYEYNENKTTLGAPTND